MCYVINAVGPGNPEKSFPEGRVGTDNSTCSTMVPVTTKGRGIDRRMWSWDRQLNMKYNIS